MPDLTTKEIRELARTYAEPHDPLFKGIEQPPLPPIPGDGDAPGKHTVASLAEKYCT